MSKNKVKHKKRLSLGAPLPFHDGKGSVGGAAGKWSKRQRKLHYAIKPYLLSNEQIVLQHRPDQIKATNTSKLNPMVASYDKNSQTQRSNMHMPKLSRKNAHSKSQKKLLDKSIQESRENTSSRMDLQLPALDFGPPVSVIDLQSESKCSYH